ncbi:hypothetical protein BU16DRAFT_364718 [Lophium mytilinum]|uniref:Uncharacterized protein n=1 Tax=Lophium mytilinum TaxID=390894 RepID=A0A6A6QY98_9PEZI|nr:hypothetical protein BU16DRAFT_364718 [Lophium mytilinum]
MFSFPNDKAPDSKCYFTHSLLPSYIEPTLPPTKKKPFSIFLTQPFTHTLDLVLPEEIYELCRQELDGDAGTLRYARVNMTLLEVLSKDFFTEYIKKGNIMMLSEGRPTVDNVFSLYEGILRIELDRPTYERCGLVGKPIEDGGKRHKKARYVIELDLRSPSMLHGKRGFKRLIWACQGVLNDSLTWLFHDLQPSNESNETAPIFAFHPIIRTMKPTTTPLPSTKVPVLSSASLPDLYDPDDSASLLEYLHLLSLASPRLCASDSIDPYLSRYEVPEFGANGGTEVRNLVNVRWHGFIPPIFVRRLYLDVLKRVEGKKGKETEQWVALNANGFGGLGGGGPAYSVLQCGARDTLCWVCD